ncbi:MAG: ligase-associated DNA damage response DEXH box helicase [Parvibaculum sp.]
MESVFESTEEEQSRGAWHAPALPAVFEQWFARRGWAPRPHQLALTQAGLARKSALLIAPTGGGKTLAGFLASLVELEARPPRKPGTVEGGLHTLYISPLKALAIDVKRNLEIPIGEMDLPITLETRTGDTSQSKRLRQRHAPPDILMTTPEQLALLLSYPDAARLFGKLQCVILDELHAMVNTKRGDLLALDLARLTKLSPRHRRIGLSATVADPDQLRRYLVPQHGPTPRFAELVMGAAGATPDVSILVPDERVPWSGHSARHAINAVYNVIRDNQTVLIFVNTRSQAEFVFQELWRANEDGLAIALHHGSLSPEQRRKVEAAMVAGTLRAIVCTSTLDLGIDWGDVDLVVNLGAPKGASRLLQRIGRANHRLDDPSRALLVPANRFEVLECEAARQAALTGVHDGMAEKKGSLDVLAQHIFGMACSGPFDPTELYEEVTSASPYAQLDRTSFDRLIDFVSHGGYALQTYDRYRRLRPAAPGDDNKQLRLAHPRLAQQYRMNVGTIVEAPMLNVRLVRKRPANGAALGRMGRALGQIEEYFIEQLVTGDTFLFAGKVLRFEGLVETEAIVTQTKDDNPAIPSYYGGKFPLSTYLASQVRHMLATPEDWHRLPAQVSEWLRIQQWRSTLPKEQGLLVETFPRGDRFYMVCYPFEGRLAHQTLGMLLTRRLDRAGARPMGFIASEYALAIWGLRDLGLMVEQKKLHLDELFAQDMLGDDLESWLAESNLMKRTFRNCAIISGLIERRFPGKEKTGRQVTFSSDLIYNVLREHEPDHILLQATHDDAAAGLLDVGRVADMLTRIKSRIELKRLDRVSPLAVPVLLDIGKEAINGDANEALLAEAADSLIEEATRLV